ncbi:MAG: hypothetical protein QCI38_02825, partial [Candidatus Thermoplasmatota archaeon]|nr:hypothetical protein [Candidatus Thermoplasmatota archaeon]
IEVLRSILPYISGLYTLPWIIVGLLVTFVLSGIFGEEKINATMKKIGLVLLFAFIPLLLFRIFLNIDFGMDEVIFSILTFAVLAFTYLLSFFYGKYEAKKHGLSGMGKRNFIKTVLTNQGRSSAFVGGALLAIDEWRVPAGIYISLVGIGLFAVMPYILSRMHKSETHGKDDVSTLPWFLKLYPWYLLSFVVAAILLHRSTGVTVASLGDTGTVVHFITALTIPAGLYYVGASIHPRDLKLEEMKKMFAFRSRSVAEFHWIAARNAFVATMIITPLCISAIFGTALFLGMIPKEWFAVLLINSILPITSTNMFLIPYGIDRKGTALAVTWTTVVSVPLFMLLIVVLSGM